MTIKISQLGNLTAVQGNAQLPIVSNITGTFTTVKSNIDQIGQYINSGVYTYGNLIPSANVAYDIGSLASQWRHLYLSGSTIYLGNTTIKAASGSITVASAPIILWNNIITTNNVVPGNVQVYGGQANGAGTLSATLTYRVGDGSYNTYNMTYGTDYVINPWVNGLGNLQILLTSTYLYSTLGWLGFGNVYITETGTTSATLSNVGVTTGNIVTPAGNLSIAGNVSITGNLIISNVYVPTANNSIGTKGQISYDSSYVYVCIATNNWRRANLAIW
jgi:predicted amino acid-binding ACT domain protein